MARGLLPKLALVVTATALVVAGVTVTPVVAQASTTTLNWGTVNTTQDPPVRLFGAMTFDSTRHRTVLFGGGNQAFTNLADTWEFDGTGWVQRAPATSPPALVGSSMAYDSVRGVSVLFGGGAPTGGDSNSTWEWDGNNWTLRSPAMAPSPRLWSTMAFDGVRGRIVLFGGDGQGSVDLGDTWEYDGIAWTRKTPASSPTPRFGAAMSYDPGLGRVVLFGGRVAGQRMADTWEWDGNNWTQITTSSAPFPRFWHTMAFDPQVGHIVVFGGDHIEPFGLGPTNDTWEFDGTMWTQDWTSTSPAVRSGQNMALDAKGRIVLFGGSDGGNPGVFPTSTMELGTGIVSPPGNPSITLPPSFEFGLVDVGTTSAASNILIYNQGTGPLLVTISTTGDFAISGGYCPTAPDPLAAGMICREFLTFTPTAGGDRFGTLVITGNVPGGSQSIALHGTGLASDFAIAASPTHVGALQGTSVTTTVSTTVIGVPSTISLSFTSTDPGLTATFSPSSITAGGSALMTINVGPSVPVGSQALDAGGTEGLAFHRVTIFVNVSAPQTDFSISASPNSFSMVQGDTATSTISTALLSGPGGSIFLDASISVGGLILSPLSPQTVTTGGSATLTMTSGTFTPPGIYTVTVKGILGTTTHSTTIVVTVSAAPPPDFSIVGAPTSISIVQGSSATSAISTAVTSGSAQSITLSASVPGVLNANLSPALITAGGGATLTVFALPTTPPGTYMVTVTGTEGSNTHSTAVAVTVILKSIVNGGFETGDLTGWTSTGAVSISHTSHTGAFAAQVGSASPSADSTLTQTFSVPASGGKLVFWYRISCGDKVKTDWFTATLRDNVTGAASTIQPPVCTKMATWTKVTVNVSAQAGHSVTLTFLTHDDGHAADPTYTLVDGVSLT